MAPSWLRYTLFQVKRMPGRERKELIQSTPGQRAPVILFFCILVSVYAAAWVVAGRLSSVENAGAVASGLTVDIVVLVPLAFYFLIIRRRGYSIVRLAPVVVVSLLVASFVLPSDQQRALHFLEAVLVPAEIGVLGWIVWRAAGAVRNARSRVALDPLEQFHDAAFGLLHNHRAAGVFASEIAVFYYALRTWRRKSNNNYS